MEWWMPIRQDLEVLPAKDPESLILGWTCYISKITMMSGFGSGAGWACECGASQYGHRFWAGADAMAKLHILNHEYEGGGRKSQFDRLIEQQLRADGML